MCCLALRARAAILVIIGLCLPGAGYSQSFRATVTGSIIDPSGAVLPGVMVTLVHLETNAATRCASDDQGRYTLLEISPGACRLEAELPGFRKAAQNLRLEVGQTARIDLRLELGELAQTVQVSAEAPLINTETSSKGEVISQEEIRDLPLEGRDFTELAYLTAGVAPKAEDGQGGFASINGARADSINFLVDGGNNQNPRTGAAQVRPGVDTIQEFRVQASNYSAEYGRLSSGVINILLKSGTNRFHGTAYEYHRNNFFDARNFFDQEKSKLLRNSFGANAGGPVLRDKVFFFASYEGMREAEGAPRLASVPTLKEREGDFSDYKFQLNDPVSRQPFARNQIPPSRFHPVSARLLDYFPLPNRDGVSNYFINKVDRDRYDDALGKTDIHLQKKHTLSVRYLLNRRFEVNPFGGSVLPTFGNQANLLQQNVGINYMHVFSPTLVQQWLFTFSRTRRLEHSINWKTNYAAALGIPGTTEDPLLFGFPRVTIRGYATLGDGEDMPLSFRVNNYQSGGATTFVRGKHQLRFGGETVRTQFFQLFANGSRGLFNFQGRWTSASTNSSEQAPLADFLLGLLNNSYRRIKQTTNYLFSTTYSLYLQEDWKVRRNLTLNLGLRYELLLPPHEKFGNWSNFVPEVQRIVVAGEPGFPRSLVFADRNNLAPRLGFAWKPPRTKLVVRAGWGLYHGMNIQNPVRSNLGGNAPFTIRENFSRMTSDPLMLTFTTPFPPQRTQVEGVNTPNGFQLRGSSGDLQHYNVTLERQLGAEAALEIGYVGSKGTHLGRRFDINQPLRSADAPQPFPRPFTGFNTIDYFAFDADSNYNALQVGLRKRGRGLNFRINYTLAKSLDDASQLSDRSAAGFSGVQDTRNRAAEHALSDFDRRHTLAASLLYAVPFGKGASSRAGLSQWTRIVFGGWQANTIIRLFSGSPITPQLANSDFTRGESRRPDRIGSGEANHAGSERWFNVNDFVTVPAGGYRFGNSGRNILVGPAQLVYDVSLLKHIRIQEQQRIELRWEIFNVPNRTNFRLPEENIDVPTAGMITQANSPRQMQVALKYIF